MQVSNAVVAAVLLLAGSPSPTQAIDNGIGIKPPRGWRSWNQFQCSINQTLIEMQYAALVSRAREVDGVPTSLLDLGYESAGIDDCWQQCDSGPGSVGFHNTVGYPIVDTSLFPDMRSMTAKAKEQGIVPGWYGNNCHCKETREDCADSDACFEGDVQATLDFGFESIKLDGCGNEKNVTKYASLFNATGKRIMIENCHNGNPTYPFKGDDGAVVCPMNFFRSSTDIRPTFGSVLINLQSTSAYNGAGLTGPGCWAYPDMLEIGVTNSQREDKGCSKFGQEGCTLNLEEAQTHFAAWCIVSAPLVLGNDLTDDETMDKIWPIISNREALEVNEAWAGDSGVLVRKADDTVHLANCSWFNDDGCDHPSWMVWKKTMKKMPNGETPSKVAVLLMNNAELRQTLTVDFTKDLGMNCAAGCVVRDIRARKDIGTFHSTYVASSVKGHDSAFLVVQARES